MIKKLILCRHAEAEPAFALKNDFSRRLTAHGIAQAKQAGAWLKQQHFGIGLIHCSAAPRARQTADLIGAELDHKEVREFPELYEASAAVLLRHVNQLPPAAEAVLLVGHNPGISALATALTGRSYQLGTAELVLISLPAGSWTEVSGGTGN